MDTNKGIHSKKREKRKEKKKEKRKKNTHKKVLKSYVRHKQFVKLRTSEGGIFWTNEIFVSDIVTIYLSLR